MCALCDLTGGQPSAAALLNLPQQSGTQYTWYVNASLSMLTFLADYLNPSHRIVNLNPGQDVTVRITDSTGATK